MLNSDDLSLQSICSRIVGFPDRYDLFKENLNRFRPINNDPISELNYNICQCVKEIVKSPNISNRRLERLYNSLAAPMLNSKIITINEMTRGWVKVLDIQKVILDKMKDYEESYTLIDISKVVGGVSYGSSIDCLLRKEGEDDVDIIMIVPKVQTHKSMHVLSNLETILAIDYLEEAGINVGKIMEVSYSHSLSDKNILCREIYPNHNTKKYCRDYIRSLEDSSINITFCNYCPYGQSCSLISKI